MIALGLGHHNLRKIPCDEAFRMDVAKLAAAVAADRAAGRLPIAVVATLGTTSSTSVDPAGAIADVARREGMWLHVDAAYAGNAAVCPEYRALLAGWERADSIVFNPHKWLFTPVDCSLLYVRDVEELRAAFSLVPEYLRTPEQGVTNLMDFGVQLGRRFRALKLWMVIRRFGAEGIRERIRLHCALGREFAEWVRNAPGFEVMAPVPFSVVCFRATPQGTPEAPDAANERLLSRVNESGEVFLSHTRLHGRFVLRLAVGNLRTTRERVERAWALIREATAS